MAENIRVRIAPSPTGKFHIGTARTALFNYLFAKRNSGTFILRIEDTDAERSEEQYYHDIIDSLLWLGLGWDEGPEVGGQFGPYRQKERLDIYKKFADQLLESKAAYKCYCTPEELDAERKTQQEKGLAPKYSGRCRNLSAAEIDAFEQEGRKSAIRFKVEPQKVAFEDVIRGRVEFDAALFGDFPIVRSDGMPLFVFTNTVDDNLMKISHVFRGEEHLANTAKQIVLAQGLKFLSPEFGHFPLIFNPDRSKMSKRKDPVSVSEDFRAKGYIPEALINFIALLGWAPGNDREIFSMKELIENFEMERVGKSPSIFDKEKLLWMNSLYIRQKTLGEIASQGQNFITNHELLHKTLDKPDYFIKVIALIQDRLKTLGQIEELIQYFYYEPEFPAEMLIAKKSTKERTLAALEAALKTLPGIKNVCVDECEPTLRSAARDIEIKDGELLWAVRVALTGKEASPGAFEMLEVLGREVSAKRIETAIKNLREYKEA